MIRAEFQLLADAPPDPGDCVPAPPATRARAKRTLAKTAGQHAPPPPAAIPAWARAGGRAGEGDPVFFAGVGLALLDAFLRCDPPSAGALRSRLALKSAAASAKILRLNADEGAVARPALRHRRRRQSRGKAAPAVERPRRPPICVPRRPSRHVAALLDLSLPDPNGLASSLKDCAAEGDPVSAAGKTAALVFSAFPDAPAAEAEILALLAFDLTLAIRLRWPRPLPLIATKILNPTLRPPGAGRRLMPNEPAWANAAAGAIALAAASALDLAADLARRAKTLIAVAPKLRAKPAAKIVDLLLSQDCVSPAEAARHAPMSRSPYGSPTPGRP